MSVLFSGYVRPIAETFQRQIEEHKKTGMHIIPIDEIGSPEFLKEILGINKEDFCVCAFMGSRPPRGLGGISEVARLYPKMLTHLDHEYNLHMPLLSGGGNYNTDKEAGLMGQWAHGATEEGRRARFVTMQTLVQREGLPYSTGTAACLKQLPDEDRVGERTDGLICIGDLFLVFPGGLGTMTELAELFTITSINRGFERKKIIIIDQIFTDPKTGDVSRFWNNDIAALITKNHAGLIDDFTAKSINSHFLIYRPDEKLTPEEISAEMISLTLAIGIFDDNHRAEVKQTSFDPALKEKHLLQLSKGSSIQKIFNGHGENGNWIDDLRKIVSGEK